MPRPSPGASGSRGRDQLRWLATGIPPARIGWGPGPLTRWRQARDRVRFREVRLALLEQPHPGTRFAAPMAFWINRRSRVCSARVNDPRGADVVWVFSQDPLPPSARQALERTTAALPPHVVVVNPPETYDAYHGDDAFPRLAAAGVRVPRIDFSKHDVGRADVVYKAQGEQPARKCRRPYAGALPGFRAFGFEDGRGADGRVRRYRAYVLGGRSWAGDVFVSGEWAISSATRTTLEHTFELTAHERDQLDRLRRCLGLDFFAVDFLRRAADGLPVFLDVNVYPTVDTPLGGAERRERGHWHVWDGPVRLGGVDTPRSPMWEEFDRAVLQLVRERAAGASSSGPPSVRPGSASSR